jgi:HEAT repeat protein
MNNPVMSEIYKTPDCTEDLPYNDISSLIERLSDPDSFIRMQAREVICCLRAPAVPALIETLSNANTQLRWEVIKVLECLQDPTTIPILVDQLMNDNAGIRWAASNALVGLQREALPTLFTALECNFDSLGLRQSAHHILHILKDDGKLRAEEVKVFEALEGIEPSVVVRWAAEKALESLRNKKR